LSRRAGRRFEFGQTTKRAWSRSATFCKDRASGRGLHGYGIVQFIQRSFDNDLLVEEGSLYPALQRLELNGRIEGVWGVTPNNRRARIYKITATGRKQLAVETRKYAKLTLAIARVMGAE
jgi:PadR family transcriptional regulator, regulatory protein PadR